FGPFLFAGLIVVQAAQPGPQNPFVGHWTADLSKSKLPPMSELRSQTLDFSAADDMVTITQRLTIGSAQHGEVQTFQTDGKEHTPEWGHGVVFVARWVNSRLLEIAAKKDSQFSRVTYELSADGNTLTSRVPFGREAGGNPFEQVIVFDRR